MKTIVTTVAVLSLAFNAVLAYRLLHPASNAPSVVSHAIAVLRTPGGLLEVSSITAEERFDSSVQHTVLGVPIGKTVAQIRVPAVYRYHVPLANHWKVRITDDAVVAIAPDVRPSLPVAIDTSKLEALSSGIWSPITGAEVLSALQKSITSRLNERAATAERLALQRESARQTVTEFIGKWVVEQQAWKSPRKPTIFVFFADEPLGKTAAPLLAPL